MAHKFFLPIASFGVALLIGSGAGIFTVAAPGADAVAAESASPPRFWSELPIPGHIAKAQSMPDFVDLAAKLSPAVVNISTDEPDEPAEGVEPPQMPEGIEPPRGHEESPHSKGPFEEFGGPQRPKALGSRFIITKDGYILTNEHVVENPGKVTVTTQDGRNYTAKIVGHDDKSDIALLKIESKHELAVAPLGDSQALKVRELVQAHVNPFGFDHSVTAGNLLHTGPPLRPRL